MSDTNLEKLPRRIVALGQLANMGQVFEQAAAKNQSSPLEAPLAVLVLAKAIVGSAQILSSTICWAALAICERLDAGRESATIIKQPDPGEEPEAN